MRTRICGISSLQNVFSLNLSIEIPNALLVVMIYIWRTWFMYNSCVCLVKTERINASCAWIYIYIQQLSSFRGPTLWFIDLTVATCYIQYTSEFRPICFTRKRTKQKYSKAAIFVSYENDRRRLLGAQSINIYWESSFNSVNQKFCSRRLDYRGYCLA